MTAPLSSNPVLRVTARVLQIAVGAVILLAAVLKAFDPPAFAEQIRGYDIFPALAGIAAWCFIIGEVLLAGALFVNLFPRLTGVLTMILMAFFIGITAYGIMIGLGGNCGCFGSLVHRSPEQVILEDALMLFAVLFSTLVLASPKQKTALWKVIVVLTLGAASAATAAFAYALPVDEYATSLRPGVRLDSWPVEGLNRDLTRGTHIIFLFSSKARDVQADITMMNAVAQSDGVPSAIGLMTEGTAAVTEVMFQYGTAFPVGAIEPRFARSLYRTLPRAFVLHEGTVTDVWPRIPAPGDARRAITRALQGR
ncbi:MAG: hypothetical protein HY962_09490 [Ignavibacteriae bacterium]|nr:hypothetical protein [Ignavibacteriota bacterium]